MATQNDSNELRVEEVDEAVIEGHLKDNNIDIAAVAFNAEQMEIALNNDDAATGSGDGAATGAKIDFKDGKAGNIVKRMVPITQTMSTPAPDLDDKKKALIEKRAEASKNEKEKADKERTGHGE